MKAAFDHVSTTNSGGDNISYADFLKSDLAKTPMGKLYIALLAENTWSKDFGVYPTLYSDKPYIAIDSRLFPYSSAGTRNFLVSAKENGSAPSVHEVAMLVLKKMEEHRLAIHGSIADLEDTKYRVEQGKESVMIGLARGAICEKFPTAIPGEAHDSRNFVWFGNKEKQEVFAVKHKDLEKGRPVPIYHLTDHDCHEFMRKIYIDPNGAECVLDNSIETTS